MSRQPTSHKIAIRALPKGIWVLGFGSMFMDMSSELIHSLLPVFMVTVLGASMVTIGIIEGIAEAAAAITRVFSGAISDYLHRRKTLVILGYGLAALSKPVFPLATSSWWVFGARFMDRIGKGIRGAPRDALVADITPPGLRGAAYGLRQALDTVGAFLGPLIALVAMTWLASDIESTMWLAVLPALVAVLLLSVGIREPVLPLHDRERGNRLKLIDGRRLPRRFWLLVLLGALFTLARFSEAFLILRATDVGLPVSYAPAVMVIMSLVYALFAYPAGAAADRLPARRLLVFGLSVLIVADILLAMATSPSIAFAGAAMWGLHMALTQGLLSKLVADNAPNDLRGTAFGIFNMVSGVALLLASVIAGTIWSLAGPPAAFIAGAVFALVAAFGLLLLGPKTEKPRHARQG
ncbi:MAG: MFS transporter [Gammaproteobacteria bacterium]